MCADPHSEISPNVAEKNGSDTSAVYRPRSPGDWASACGKSSTHEQHTGAGAPEVGAPEVVVPEVVAPDAHIHDVHALLPSSPPPVLDPNEDSSEARDDVTELSEASEANDESEVSEVRRDVLVPGTEVNTGL